MSKTQEHKWSTCPDCGQGWPEDAVDRLDDAGTGDHSPVYYQIQNAFNPFTGMRSEAHVGPPDEGENADCPEQDCKGVMVPQIPCWLVGNSNRQWFECDECGYKVKEAL